MTRLGGGGEFSPGEMSETQYDDAALSHPVAHPGNAAQVNTPIWGGGMYKSMSNFPLLRWALRQLIQFAPTASALHYHTSSPFSVPSPAGVDVDSLRLPLINHLSLHSPALFPDYHPPTLPLTTFRTHTSNTHPPIHSRHSHIA